MRTASRLVLGSDITTLGQRVDALHQMLRATTDPNRLWLYEHRLERMDATTDIFDAARRAFHLARYAFAAPFVPSQVVVDIACGTGYGTECLVLQGQARRAIGVDVDAQAIAYARTTHQPAAAEFLCASGEATGLPAGVADVVVSFETIEHVHDDAALLVEFHRLLRPGGVLICSTPNNWPIDRSPGHVRTYDRRAFEQALGGRFESIELYNQNSGTPSSFNHGQPTGIRRTTPDNESTAECYIAVCVRSPS